MAVKKSIKKSNSKKTNTSNISPKKKYRQKKTPDYFEQYSDLFLRRMKPVSDIFLDRVSRELIEWAFNNKEALVIKDFFYEKGIPPRYAYRWAERCKNLKDAMQDAKGIIGSRREKGAIKREYDSSMIKSVQHLYDDDWRKSEEWRSELRAKQDEKAKNNNIKWVLEKFPNSKLVPEKEDK